MKVEGLGLKVEGVGLDVEGLGFKVEGSDFSMRWPNILLLCPAPEPCSMYSRPCVTLLFERSGSVSAFVWSSEFKALGLESLRVWTSLRGVWVLGFRFQV